MSRKKIMIALQGGGAHGAFSWGVLDRLLEDGRFDIMGISGTSAGAMNAACVIQGLTKEGPELARATLEEYWKGVSDLSAELMPPGLKELDTLFARDTYNLDHFPWFQMEANLSPYEANPLNINPFSDFIQGFFDFDAIRHSKERRIFLAATHVKTGKIKIFSNKDFSPKVLLASACLPFMFQAVEVDHDYYWDGGYIANPAIFPLIGECETSDIVMVQLTKSHCDEIPTSRAQIIDRLKEITYNGCLVHEMRAIYFITKLIDEGKIKPNALKRISMHVIKNEETFHDLNLSSALNADWEFLSKLHKAGRQAADKWIHRHYEKVGTNSHTIDEKMFADFMS